MNIDNIIKDLNMTKLTPVQKVGGLYIKREDMFKPFDFSNVNGTKLRQCIYLILKNINTAKNGVLTCCSIHSPQGIIVTSVCKYLNIKSTVFYGATTYERLDILPIPRMIKDIGGSIEIVSKIGRMSVLKSKAIKRKENTCEFLVEHGMDLMENTDCFLKSVANQVQNIPENLDNLVITCGSAITTTGILYGLRLFNKDVKNIILVGVAPNRVEKIYKNLAELEDILKIKLSDTEFKYIDLFNTKGFKYEKKEYANHFGLEFHPNYEAKTYKWLIKNIDYKNEKTCFWVIGGDINEEI